MHNPAIMGAHLTHQDRFSDSLCFFGETVRELFQVFLAGFQVAFNINLDANPVIIVAVFIDDFFNQRLNRFQGLSAFADQNRRISTGNIK